MKIDKPINELKIAVLIPCFCRHEYTAMCLESAKRAQEYNNTTFYLVDDGSSDGITYELISNIDLPKVMVKHEENLGLRATILEYFKWARENKIDIIGIIGNDSLLYHGWLDKIISTITTTDLDIVSPNYLPSNPAFTQGKEDVHRKGYREAVNIVGLWFMDRRLTDNIQFDDLDVFGIRGSISIMNQIKIEKDPKIGWIPDALLEDAGHWSGESKYHIKSKEHEEYSKYVGRSINWKSE